MKISDDQVFTVEVGNRYIVTIPVELRRRLKAIRDIDLHPKDIVTLAFVKKGNGEGTKQRTLLEIDGADGNVGRAKGGRKSKSDHRRDRSNRDKTTTER